MIILYNMFLCMSTLFCVKIYIFCLLCYYNIYDIIYVMEVDSMNCIHCRKGFLVGDGFTYIIKGNEYMKYECTHCNRKGVLVINGWGSKKVKI
jgi:hypothetical protein